MQQKLELKLVALCFPGFLIPEVNTYIVTQKLT